MQVGGGGPMAGDKVNRGKAVKRPGGRAKSLGKTPSPVEKAYARARQLSRKTGETVRFVVGVGPDGAESVTGFAEDSASFAISRYADARHSELGRALADARRRGELRVAEILA